ncbi:MAG: WD40 repeat domain-containing protein, partial [bacterium]
MKKFISYLLILVLFGSALNFSFDITQVNANNISKENREAWKFIDYIEFVNEKIFDVSLSTQEEIAALGLEKGKVKIWNFVNREIITTIKETNEDIISLDFSSKKNKLLFVAEDNILRIWDLSDDSLDKEIAFESTINEAMYIPGTDKAVLQYSDYLVLVVDLESEEIIKSFNLPENEAINAFSVCETGRYIAVAGDEIINIWDLNNGELFNSIKWEIGDGPAPMTLWINAVDLSRKAKLVAAGG